MVIRNKFKTIAASALLLCCLTVLAPIVSAVQAQEQTNEEQPVFVIPVSEMVDEGMLSFLKRAFAQAHEANAQYIILDINTLGGLLTVALDIGTLIQQSQILTIAFINGQAASAGAYIALSADQIVMIPGSSFGAAAIVDQSGAEVESAKDVSYWVSQLQSAAEANGRDPIIAAGMADKNIIVELPEINHTFGEGTIVSLTAEQALRVGYSEQTVRNLNDVLQFIGAENAPIEEADLTFAENLSRFVTNPIVKTILLLVGIAGVAIEIFVPGFGVPGIIGLLGFGLYFFGHYIAGFAGLESIGLFVAGIILLLLEVILPGVGFFAIAGSLALFSGIVLASYDTGSGLRSLAIALLIAIVVVAIVIRIFKHRGIWNKFVLKEELKTELGYSSSKSKTHLLGLTGEALTTLRPSGTAQIGEEKVDVVTDGGYIDRGRPVKVVKIEGTRVVVTEIK
ncbi:NfeD family protein [Paenibacillus senegalensis]|uniref:NfeD family protein n=1 Tax=Paenibacillus senegalensis TaxID=1465766 RepID=UPI000289D923|nr:NfeD family protein [Paenibacillus senegalensis]